MEHGGNTCALAQLHKFKILIGSINYSYKSYNIFEIMIYIDILYLIKSNNKQMR